MTNSITSRPPVVIAALSVLAIGAFLGVTRLVNRFAEQQKAAGRHLYQQGLTEQQSGKLEPAIVHFRSALTYDRDNFDYQLSLARALRDTGRTEEAQTYLLNLWERSPQDGAINLALGRLAARQHSLDRTLQFYHNAVYGVWPSDPDTHRLDCRFELVNVLLDENARAQAQAELISLSAELPRRPELYLRVADLFTRAQDYDHAFAEYHHVLQLERANPQALVGAGQSAFHLARYREAEQYLQAAVKANPQDSASGQLLAVAHSVTASDPFAPGISDNERMHRLRDAFTRTGDRLQTCAQSQGIDLTAQTSGQLSALETDWLAMKPQLARMRLNDADLTNSAMNLISRIEQGTQAECGAGDPIDQALVLIAQKHAGAEP
jgi:tetratricopeptide (TPR) repeat protein